ncbi:MAG: TonB-dependent receptor [Muribaculaceae bacterium]|nr:TonB-dependent receptor [Muribaculaceae bacterium]
MSRKAFMVVLAVVCLALPALAQKITVKGTVVDSTGEPLIGATVLAKGTTMGTSTDIDGNFAIEVPANATLTFSYVGCNPQEVAVDGRTNIDVTMSENSVILKEVVAIGYGVVKKSDATGSVAVIRPDDVEAATAKSVQDLLVGASPGVTVTTNGGNPTGSATIRIRGGSSISASNDPLIVIDGVPASDGDMIVGTGVSALTSLNPNDIESMTVLKDASATAIYGSRASNGVILVTTKKGSSGRPKVAFAANWHYAKARKTLKVLDGNQYRALANKLFGDDPTYAEHLKDLGKENTNWQDLILRGSFSQDYSLSVSGTAGFLPYRVSVGFSDNNGIIRNNKMQRTTVGINLSPKFFNGLLSINANATGSYINLKGYGNEGLVASAMSYNPTVSPYMTYNMAPGSVGQLFNGYYYYLPNGQIIDQGQGNNNPLASLNSYDKSGKTLSSTGNLQIDYALHFLPELHLNLNLGYEFSKADQQTISQPGSRGAWSDTALANMKTADKAHSAAAAGTLWEWSQINRNTLLDFYLNYRKEFAAIQSKLDVTAGYSWQRFFYKGGNRTKVNSLGYITDNGKIPVNDQGQYLLQWDEGSKDLIGQYVTNSQSNWSAPNQLISFFGRLNWTLQDTYLLTFTIRDDGSSRFSKNNRWALFPSLALGWKVSNMPVFEPVRGWWNDLKLRLGWGLTGQQNVGGAFPYLATYTFSNGAFQYPAPDGKGYKVDPETGKPAPDGWIYPLYPNGYDESLKWETTETWNVGLDFGFLENRITAAVDWYLRKTRDLLYGANIAGTGTAATITRNIGSMQNMGVELTLTARPVVTKNFTWTTGFNWAYNNSKITKLTGDNAADSQPARGLPIGTGGYIQYFVVDQEPYAFRVMEQVYDKAGDPIPGVYVDQNNDGVINDDDFVYYHSPAPKHTFSWNNTFTFYNFDLGFALRANLGNYVYNGPKASYGFTSQMTQYGWNNVLDNTFLYGDISSDSYHYYSSYYVENASFLRCDNISLGYTFDEICKNKVGLRVFAVVQNPFVITKYKGIDPEVFSGIDSSVYPNPTTYTLGVTLNF